ncbi:MAG TPA: STAS domain-containing protein [Xanthomonadales bacterium]|nr:STAS domain-containing protein [Xanthomonadales bacterium]
MQITDIQEGNVVVVCPVGRIDSTTAAELERACDDHLARGAKRLLLDLGGTQYVSSAGLRVFLVVGKKLQRVGGRLALCNMQPLVREVMAIAGFDRILTTADSRGAGLAKLI